MSKFINHGKAMAILTGKGDYSDLQAEIILLHANRVTLCGQTLYLAAYINSRAS